MFQVLWLGVSTACLGVDRKHQCLPHLLTGTAAPVKMDVNQAKQ